MQKKKKNLRIYRNIFSKLCSENSGKPTPMIIKNENALSANDKLA